MEFWGIELKGDKPVKVIPDESQVVHLSQATLPNIKKGSDPVTIYAKIGTQKLAIGILSADKYPQLSFDLVFEKEVELSHNSKNGNVHLTGYKSLISDDEDEEGFSDYSEDDMPLTLTDAQNGAVAAAKAKPAAPAAAKKDNKPKEESDDDDSSSDEDDSGDSSDEDMADGDSDADSDDESDEEEETPAKSDIADSDSDADSDDESDEEEETPVKSAGGKKRPNSATKTPEPTKKAKIVTPKKSDGKKSVGGHIATPHPAKNAEKTPKSGGQMNCGSCKKTFNSQGALDSHTKAKHSAK